MAASLGRGSMPGELSNSGGSPPHARPRRSRTDGLSMFKAGRQGRGVGMARDARQRSWSSYGTSVANSQAHHTTISRGGKFPRTRAKSPSATSRPRVSPGQPDQHPSELGIIPRTWPVALRDRDHVGAVTGVTRSSVQSWHGPLLEPSGRTNLRPGAHGPASCQGRCWRR